MDDVLFHLLNDLDGYEQEQELINELRTYGYSESELRNMSMTQLQDLLEDEEILDEELFDD